MQSCRGRAQRTRGDPAAGSGHPTCAPGSPCSCPPQKAPRGGRATVTVSLLSFSRLRISSTSKRARSRSWRRRCQDFSCSFRAQFLSSVSLCGNIGDREPIAEVLPSPHPRVPARAPPQRREPAHPAVSVRLLLLWWCETVQLLATAQYLLPAHHLRAVRMPESGHTNLWKCSA